MVSHLIHIQPDTRHHFLEPKMFSSTGHSTHQMWWPTISKVWATVADVAICETLNPSKPQFILLDSQLMIEMIVLMIVLSSIPALGITICHSWPWCANELVYQSCSYGLCQTSHSTYFIAWCCCDVDHSVFVMHLYYCNAVPAGLPNFWIHQFQSVLNCTARVVANLQQFCIFRNKSIKNYN